MPAKAKAKAIVPSGAFPCIHLAPCMALGFGAMGPSYKGVTPPTRAFWVVNL
jgi:hypothetical protein